MKLVGMYDSPYVRRVAVSMRILGIPFEHLNLSVFRNQDEMRKINPLLKVPTLVLDDGQTLMDSSFILDHLDRLVPPEKRLLPTMGEARLHMLQHCAVALVAMEKAVQVHYEKNLRPTDKVHAPWLERVTRQMHDAFVLLEGIPSVGVLSGAPINQADISSAVALRFARFVHPDEFPAGRYPALDRLSAHCEALPAFIETPLE